ncbi:MAG: hypothetical protein ACI90V_004413 [Bacillariaceae sp.]|jgi:hypothetical protein
MDHTFYIVCMVVIAKQHLKSFYKNDTRKPVFYAQ